MSRHEFHQRMHEGLLAAIAVTMPFPLKLNSLLILLCALNWLIGGRLVEKVKNTFRSPLNVCWILFFAWHVLSYFMSHNQHEAGAIIERRLAMLAFPLLVSGSVNGQQCRRIAMAFVCGVSVALLWCMAMAGYHYITTHDAAVFFYHALAGGVRMNAVYLAAYAVFAIHIVLQYSVYFTGAVKRLYWPVLGVLFTGCLLLNSKMMLFVLFSGLVFRLLRTQHVKDRKRIAGIVVITVCMALAGILSVPQIRERFTKELSSDFRVLEQQQFRYDTPFTGTSLRLRIWKFCFNIMDEQHAWLTGVGTGDFQDLLNEKYKATGMYTGNPELHDTGYLGYGPHSAYMEVLFTLGMPACIFFLALLVLQWRYAWKSKHYLLLQLLWMFTLFCLTESVLSTNKGIVFFLFFLCLFDQSQDLSKKIRNPAT